MLIIIIFKFKGLFILKDDLWDIMNTEYTSKEWEPGSLFC